MFAPCQKSLNEASGCAGYATRLGLMDRLQFISLQRPIMSGGRERYNIRWFECCDRVRVYSSADNRSPEYSVKVLAQTYSDVRSALGLAFIA
jgi:hypothetical protein